VAWREEKEEEERYLRLETRATSRHGSRSLCGVERRSKKSSLCGEERPYKKNARCVAWRGLKTKTLAVWREEELKQKRSLCGVERRYKKPLAVWRGEALNARCATLRSSLAVAARLGSCRALCCDCRRIFGSCRALCGDCRGIFCSFRALCSNFIGLSGCPRALALGFRA